MKFSFRDVFGFMMGLLLLSLVYHPVEEALTRPTVLVVHTLRLHVSETTPVDQLILQAKDGTEVITTFKSLGRQGLGIKVVVAEIDPSLRPSQVCINDQNQCLSLDSVTIVDAWRFTVRAETIYSASLKQDVREPRVSRTSFFFAIF